MNTNTPTWGGALEVTRCPVCGTEGEMPGLLSLKNPSANAESGGLKYVKCTECTSAFQNHMTPVAYEAPQDPVTLTRYIEQDAGIDSMLSPLYRIQPANIKSYLEVGCGYGFSLDFARFTFGWHVKGIDPSQAAAAGRDDLQLDISTEYFSEDCDLAKQQFDLVMGSEVIEHIPNPIAFLTALRGVVANEGILALTTPNANFIRPGTKLPILHAIVNHSHLVLLSPESLELVLMNAGFSFVRIFEVDSSIHAFASRGPMSLSEGNSIDRDAYRRYLENGWENTEQTTALGCGFGYRLYKELVNAAHYAEAAPLFNALQKALLSRFSIDLHEPRRIIQALGVQSLQDFARSFPFNICGTLYHRGVFEIATAGDVVLAADYFRVALETGSALLGLLGSSGQVDLETEDLVGHSRKHLLVCQAEINPGIALFQLKELRQQQERRGDSVPISNISVAELECLVFARLVLKGNYFEAETLLPFVKSHLADLEILGSIGVPKEELLFCLGMLALNHAADYEQAAQFFAEAHARAVFCLQEDLGEHFAKGLVWQALFHEGLAKKFGGKSDSALAIARRLDESERGGNATLPPVEREILQRIPELLS